LHHRFDFCQLFSNGGLLRCELRKDDCEDGFSFDARRCKMTSALALSAAQFSTLLTSVMRET
jgi:hypothetical protein